MQTGRRQVAQQPVSQQLGQQDTERDDEDHDRDAGHVVQVLRVMSSDQDADDRHVRGERAELRVAAVLGERPRAAVGGASVVIRPADQPERAGVYPKWISGNGWEPGTPAMCTT
ncbi:hypothetical protein Ahu01nite_013910 [Winogradskya humida]|uniref:Uncharacterized protein n=1 Tax=Winogradskya humida TaxID=113566 RepID=A0ABQ3ZI72_9ACTN|nr:hypothetical protein Ahu01nite_013910 [Actinoplanes humidus]